MSNLDQLIASVERGDYRPSSRTVGERLLTTHDCACYGKRSLASFARAALRAEGLWWVMSLEASPDALSYHEGQYIAEAWRQWIDGERPFRIGAPRVLR